MTVVIGRRRSAKYRSVVITEVLMIEAGLIFCLFFVAAFAGFEKGLGD